mgnify:CR=1 FL=1
MITKNNFYGNTTGIATDSLFAGGHPGYPQDGAVFEDNKIYSNNFNSFEAGSDVEPRVPVPVGTGIFIAGGNGNEIRGNRIWDNWRRGTMLINVPDSLSDEKRVGTIEAVEQLTRYLGFIRADPAKQRCRGILAAQAFKPQAVTLAESRGIACVEVDLAVLRGEREPELTLFAP